VDAGRRAIPKAMPVASARDRVAIRRREPVLSALRVIPNDVLSAARLSFAAVDGDLTSTAGIVALAAAGGALIALIVAAIALLRLRRVRADQRVVLGDRERRDLVEQGAQLERHFRDLNTYVEDVAGKLTERLAVAEERLDGAIAHSAMVRYDAYNEMSGRQSTTIALLDSRRSGVVVSSIHHRDQARVYAKQVTDGKGELELSPEEEEAVRIALGGE
jgi:Protein of unknown function (DUF4446)